MGTSSRQATRTNGQAPLVDAVPRAPDLERAFIGSCFLLDDVAPLLRIVEDDCFMSETWRLAWRHIIMSYEREEAPDPRTIAHRIAEETGGDVDRLVRDLVELLEDPDCIGAYALPRARELRRLAAKRTLMELGTDVTYEAANGADPEGITSYIRGVAEQLDELTAAEEDGGWSEVIADLESGSDRWQGMPTGVEPYDRWTYGGLRRGEILVIAGPSGKGKTWLMTQMANGLADDGRRVAIYTLEMSKAEIFIRLMAGRMGNRAFALRGQGAQWSADEYAVYQSARDRLERSGLVGHVEQRSMQQIAASVRQHRPEVFCIDYLQLLDLPKGSSSVTEGTDLNCKAIMDLCARTGAAAIVLSQMSRSAINAAGQGGVLGGLNASAIDNMAHAWVYIDQQRDSDKLVELELRKARHVPTGGKATLRMDAESGKLVPV